MQSFLVHLATLSVMVHLTFGCSLHHGMGSAHTCQDHAGLTSCCSMGGSPSENEFEHEFEHEHGGHDPSDHHADPSSKITFVEAEASHHQHHLNCHNDGCKVNKLVKFVIAESDSSTAYLGGAEDSAISDAIVGSQFPVDTYLSDGCSAPKVRTHLLFGVQLI